MTTPEPRQFGKIAPTTGHEKLLFGCLLGDMTLLHRSDMVEAAWKIGDPILNTWAGHPPPDMEMQEAVPISRRGFGGRFGFKHFARSHRLTPS